MLLFPLLDVDDLSEKNLLILKHYMTSHYMKTSSIYRQMLQVSEPQNSWLKEKKKFNLQALK